MIQFGVADYGMNVWDGANFDCEMRLQELKKLGFNGIERLEVSDPASAVYKAMMFRRNEMDFATVETRVPETAIQWTAAFGKKYVWLASAGRNVDMATYCRRTNRMLEACEKYHIFGALHNHMGQRIQNQDELDQFMTDCPKAKLLLDIGHLHAAGGDVCGTIERYFDRIASVHFKDVLINRDAAPNTQFWSFCELGAGNSGLDYLAAAQLLKKRGYSAWVLIEHDQHVREPLVDLAVSLGELKKVW